MTEQVSKTCNQEKIKLKNHADKNKCENIWEIKFANKLNENRISETEHAIDLCGHM